VPPGSARSVQVGGRMVAIVNHVGTFHAVDGECSHAGGPLGEGQVGGCQLACPWHGAVYDVRTGQVMRGPARKAVRTYQVTIAGGTVYVAVV
jgi:nitrite reductase/ring-hydroxylating ferredoxin subunit